MPKKKKKKLTPEELQRWELDFAVVVKERKLSLDGARAIKGWMFPEELLWLAETARGLRRIIEVGSYMGRSARAMLDNSEAHIWCVDSWATAYTSDPVIYEGFLKNIKGQKERVTILRMQSDEAAVRLMELHGPSSFDMVFIDGGHSYSEVKADILGYTPLVRAGGIISGHDYSPINREVMVAVDELLEEFEVVKTLWWKVKH